jgi:hypothetical protein
MDEFLDSLDTDLVRKQLIDLCIQSKFNEKTFDSDEGLGLIYQI